MKKVHVVAVIPLVCNFTHLNFNYLVAEEGFEPPTSRI